MKALDLFSGAGGMSLGAKMAGINVLQAVEVDSQACRTFQYNFPGTRLFCGNIADFNCESLDFNPDIIFGGPPCQGFSTSNQKTRSSTNPLNWLFQEFLRLIEEATPKWIVIENVKGLIESNNRSYFEAIIKGLNKLSYTTSVMPLNSVFFGVPQNRTRLFIVGNRNSQKFEFPKEQISAPIPVIDAIKDLPVLDNGACIDVVPYEHDPQSEYAWSLRRDLKQSANNIVSKNSDLVISRYRHIPQGGNWQHIPDDLMQNYKDRNRCHTGIYHRLKWTEPSVVIGNYRKNMLIHPEQHRGLSVREAARLQSFPDYFEFKGSIGFQQQQVGNAVPPKLAHAIFKHIMSY